MPDGAQSGQVAGAAAQLLCLSHSCLEPAIVATICDSGSVHDVNI